VASLINDNDVMLISFNLELMTGRLETYILGYTPVHKADPSGRAV
jgi:hypothetical protein